MAINGVRTPKNAFGNTRTQGTQFFIALYGKKIYTHEETRVNFFLTGDLSFFVFLVFPKKKVYIDGVITPFVLEHNWEHNGNTIFCVFPNKNPPFSQCVTKEKGGKGAKNYATYLRSSILMR